MRLWPTHKSWDYPWVISIEMLIPGTLRACFFLFLIAAFLLAGSRRSQSAEIAATLQLVSQGKAGAIPRHPTYAAMWLEPSEKLPASHSSMPARHYRMDQHDKKFVPHLLVVPAGSIVDFPNRDPFYHNVFSLYHGKRFDLGLYESGSQRSVRFNRPGIHFIFCNIHPQMGAVIIVLSTPYFAVASPKGEIAMDDVPPGVYEMRLWAEGAGPDELESLTRTVRISSSGEDLGAIRIAVNPTPASHKNKFGEDYAPPSVSPY